VNDRPRSVTIFTHRRTAQTAPAIATVVRLAAESGAEVRVPSEEAEKHDFEPHGDVRVVSDPGEPTDLVIALGGDGTILGALRTYAGTGTPVFAVNYGTIGFLATVEPDELEDGIRHALTGGFDVMRLPVLVADTEQGEQIAVNDISFHRRQNGRVAELAYSVDNWDLGEVRCDGLVVASAAGSTGYNLANGGPVMAWGVEGFVVSFIAPHSLTARALVVAPDDLLTINNTSREDPVELHVDGRPVTELPAGEDIHVEFVRDQGLLAQLPGASFYHRLRERFGRLAR
jgi:NAD+ kinase